MADFINATIDDREFENLIKAMNYQGIHLSFFSAHKELL